MAPGTSPAITGLTNGAYEEAFSENFGRAPCLSLEGWTTDRDVIALDSFGVTSPSITSEPPPTVP